MVHDEARNRGPRVPADTAEQREQLARLLGSKFDRRRLMQTGAAGAAGLTCRGGS